MRNMIILRNAIKCNHCGDIIESTHVHDFKECSCKRVFVDGGHEYMRRGFKEKDDYTELSEYREKTFEDKVKEEEEMRLRELKEREDFYRLVKKLCDKENDND